MSQPGHKRIGRIARWSVGFALAVWFGCYAYFCLTAEPPGADPSLWEPVARRDTVDATDELIAILDTIPAPPTFTLPEPPAGQRWLQSATTDPLDIDDALRGDWTPETRPYLRAIIAYLETPAIGTAAEKLYAMSQRSVTSVRYDDVWHYSVHNFRTLAAHARREFEAHGDREAARRALEAALWLVWEVRDGSFARLYYATSLEWNLVAEMRHYSFQATLTGRESRAMTKLLAELPSVATAWPESIEHERRDELALVDSYYSKDETGDGVLLLGAAAPSELPISVWLPQRSRAWNLAAAIYNGRNDVMRKLETRWEALRSVSGEPYSDALDVLGRYGNGHYSIVDGPILHRPSWIHDYAYVGLLYATAHRRAVMIMLALDQYYQRNWRYPASLDELVPRFMDILPEDPFCEGGFGYRTESPRRYQLWSCGYNGKDDGGVAATEQLDSDFREMAGDVLYAFARNPPQHEPQAEPIHDDDDDDAGE